MGDPRIHKLRDQIMTLVTLRVEAVEVLEEVSINLYDIRLGAKDLETYYKVLLETARADIDKAIKLLLVK